MDGDHRADAVPNQLRRDVFPFPILQDVAVSQQGGAVISDEDGDGLGIVFVQGFEIALKILQGFKIAPGPELGFIGQAFAGILRMAGDG